MLYGAEPSLVFSASRQRPSRTVLPGIRQPLSTVFCAGLMSWGSKTVNSRLRESPATHPGRAVASAGVCERRVANPSGHGVALVFSSGDERGFAPSERGTLGRANGDANEAPREPSIPARRIPYRVTKETLDGDAA